MARNFGIVVSGGPAPGINSVIAAVVIEASNRGHGIYGLVDGFKGISTRGSSALIPLTTDTVSRIHSSGGSIIGTSRYNPFAIPPSEALFFKTLSDAEIDSLVVIGGEGSASLSRLVAKKAPSISVVHVPKTIDNDIDLPESYPTFGFDTARAAGTRILDVLMADAQTTKRWFLVTCMGRRAGFLALGIGISGGATLTLIPEEFSPHSQSPESIAEIIFKSIQLRSTKGKSYGAVVMAEGLWEALAPESTPALATAPRDSMGRVKYSEIELSDIIGAALKKRCAETGIPLQLTTKNIGYELRCCAPSPFDIEYTRVLGYGAVSAALARKTNVLITRVKDSLQTVDLDTMVGSDGGIRPRTVHLDSDLYTVAQRYMIK